MRNFVLNETMRAKCVIQGLKRVSHPDVPSMVLTEVVDFEFSPGVIVKVEDDSIDMSPAVESRLIVEVLLKEENVASVDDIDDVKVEEKINIEENVIADVIDKGEVVKEEIDDVENEVVSDDTVDGDFNDEQENSYEELSDGSLLCLLCKKEGIRKILKQHGSMENHLRDKH